MLLHSLQIGEELTIGEAIFVIVNVLEGQLLQLRNKSNGALVNRTRNELMTGYTLGTVRFVDPTIPGDGTSGATVQGTAPRRFNPPLATLSDAGRKESKRRRQYLAKLGQRNRLRWDRSNAIDAEIKKIAAEIEDTHPPHRTTVHRWYRQWIKRNRDTQGVPCRFDRRGGAGQGRFVDEVEHEIRVALDEVFLQETRPTAKEAWHALVRRIEALNLKRHEEEKHRIPSLRSFQRRAAALCKYEVVARREGDRAAKRRFRAVLGKLKVGRILERVEMDHTPLNLFVIHDESMLPLGRPELTVALDKKSRLVLGFWIGFTGHGADAVLGCLSHAIRPKMYYADRYPHIKLPNPGHGLMSMLALDNGTEFHGDDLVSACAELGIDILYMPARKPEWKGSVERFLKTFNHSLIHQIPGTTFENIATRGDYDPAKHAIVTFSDLERLIETWICDVYHNEVHRGLNARPIDIWNEGVAAEEPALPTDINRLDFHLGESEQRTLWHYGVELWGERFNNRELAELHATYGKIRAQIRFHRADISRIWVKDPATDEYFEVPNIDQEYASGVSLEQHEFVKKRATKDAEGKVNRVALHAAKGFIQDEIRRLMSGKTLRDRRKAARMAGTNSAPKPKDKVLTEYSDAQVEAIKNAAVQTEKSADAAAPTVPAKVPATPRKRALPKFNSRESGKAAPL